MIDDKALSRGFMVANNGLQIHGENTNDVVSTEAFMMLKEHIVEPYGRIRYTMAEGCSGGSYQLMDEAMYPGLLDGLQPNCTYVDLWTTASDVFDCGLFVRYFSGRAPGGPPLARWMPAIDGHKDPSNCAAWDATFFGYSDPTNAGHCDAPRRAGLPPGDQPRRRALHDRRLHEVDLRAAAAEPVDRAGEEDRPRVRQPAVGQRGRAVRARRAAGRGRSRRRSSSTSTRRSAA